MKEVNQRAVPAAISQLRAEIEALPRDQGGKRQGIHRDLKERIANAWVDSQMRLTDFSKAVLVSPSALCTWRRLYCGQKKILKRKQALRKSGFKKMIVTEDATATRQSFTIDGPNGIRLTGLGAEDVVRLWRALC